MHDFCLTIPYSLVLMAGALVACTRKGSTASPAGDALALLGSSVVFLLAGFINRKLFEKRRNSYLAWFSETACSLLLTFVMGQKYLQTSMIMPAGVVSALSALMAVFYLYKIATGGNHNPPKAE